MPELHFQKDFRSVRHLPFCYLCGKEFVDGDDRDGDHVPPKTVFNKRDRGTVLKLKTHKVCNSSYSVEDKKVGQLIALGRRENPSSARDFALRFTHYPELGVAVENLNVDATVWRWIKGFHAALYTQPLIGNEYALQTPFPRADMTEGQIKIRPIHPQHVLAVETIKNNRAQNNLDVIISNNGKLRYECIWCQADDKSSWFCMFALDIYDWKDLGSHTEAIPARGCTGVYMLPDQVAPVGATLNRASSILIPNYDILDPFAR